MKRIGWGMVALALAPAVAHASKYTGPRSADLFCRVSRVLAGAAEVPPPVGYYGIEWRLAPAVGERLVEAETIGVLSYDDNGWGTPSLVPKRVYVAVPPTQAAVGRTLLVHLAYSGAWNKFMMLHHVVDPKSLGERTYSPDINPVIKKIRALADLNELARRNDDRLFEEALHDLKADHNRRHKAYRMDSTRALAPGQRARCATGEHAVRSVTVLIVRGERSVTTSEAALHDIEFHGTAFSRAEESVLDEILR